MSVPGVLGNDTDMDGNPLNAIATPNPLSGVLTFNANGSFVYSPTVPYFNGVDRFIYHASDGAHSTPTS